MHDRKNHIDLLRNIEQGVRFFCRIAGSEAQCVDVIFPVVHGPNGEDGTIQGLLELV
ncbi:hypothetical protein EN829_057265, partial [Mesorhizobium sp. M00.F.Ca.ET.186.01.1.1]